MRLGKHLGFLLLSSLSLVASGCSGGGGGSSGNSMLGALQDLTVDPEGKTTVLTFRSSALTSTHAGSRRR